MLVCLKGLMCRLALRLLWQLLWAIKLMRLFPAGGVMREGLKQDFSEQVVSMCFRWGNWFKYIIWIWICSLGVQ